ncbi:MAG: hypothetical protein IKI81_06455 [Selenomonadaceae bacterium]|nr:hypothetical protein [Selenomonadaceae bacterium]
MKKKNAVPILLYIALAAGIVIGSYFVYASQGIYPFVLAGVLCYLASVSTAVLLCCSRKGITGKRLLWARVLTAVLGVPLAVCTVVTVLQACCVRTIVPPQMTSGNWHPEFSFREDMQNLDMASPLVKTEGFVNVDEADTELTFYDQNAVERAKLELGGDNDIHSYSMAHDKTEDVWRISFNRQDKVTLHVIQFATV